MNSYPGKTEGNDLQALRDREPKVVERWFLEHADVLYTFVFYRVGRDQELATDMVQETFLTALRRIEDYDPDRGAMMAWLTYLARNCIRTALRKRGRYETYAEIWENIDRDLLAAYMDLETSPLPQELLERQETAELVQMTLANLPDKYRRALEQHYYLQQSLADIAHAEGMTEGAVKSLLHRARLAFKSAFQACAAALDDQFPARGTLP